MRKETEQLLRELTEADGVPGFEQEVRKLMRVHLEPLGDIEVDRLGSIVCKKTGTADSPRIMLPAHMDEIGFMVKLVTDKGFVKFSPLGGWWSQVLLAQRLRIKTQKGDVVGVLGAKPPHLLKSDERNKVVELRDMYLDIGAKDKKAAEAMGVRPGDPIVPVSAYERLNGTKCLLAKAWDDRAGCAVMIEALRQLQRVKHPNTVYGAGTIQEEVGLKGAKTAAAVIEPDVALALDVGIAADTPGIKDDETQGELGKGPQICVRDGGMIPNVRLRDLAIKLCEEKKIPYQFQLLEGGTTDGSAIQVHSQGVACLYLGIATRHIHSHCGILHETDFDNTVKLVVELVKVLDAETVAGLAE
jgi:endoglucanase